jgi:hypothetical protein
MIKAYMLGIWLFGPALALARPPLAEVWVNHHRHALTFSIQSLMIFPRDAITVRFRGEKISLNMPGPLVLNNLPQDTSRPWSWQAPQTPGLYILLLRRGAVQEQINFVVQVPYERIRQMELNGYRIGGYPHKRKIKNLVYRHPRGFIEVTPENEKAWLSPHFQLKQFLCKQHDAYPKYITLKEGLLTKLEALIRLAHQHGIACSTLVILSGYRTPYYNQLLGNVTYSAHLYGKAADIYIDENHDGLMDDLNHDGSLDIRDAEVLYQLVERLEQTPLGGKLKGGLGLYDRTTMHTPFVHMDIRGYQARWGVQPLMEQAKRKSGAEQQAN